MKKDMIKGISLLTFIVTISIFIPYFAIGSIVIISAIYYHNIESKNKQQKGN